MKLEKAKPTLLIRKGDELFLSGSGLVEILKVVLNKGTSCKFTAKGHSMDPFIRDGDEITLSPSIGYSPMIGDIVAFIHPVNSGLMVHRLIGKKDDSYLTKGDNASQADGLVQKINILGYVQRIERKGKQIYLGLGPERILISYLSQKRLLSMVLLPAWKITPSFIKKWLR